MKKVLKNKKGFTLIELLICLFIIGLMMLLILPNIASQRDKAQKQADTAIIKVVEGQEEVYKIDHNGKVPSVEELKNERYIDEKQAKAYNEAKTRSQE